jgi:hypothetical protein
MWRRVAERCSGGEVIRKKHKERSDKGTKRKRKGDAGREEEEDDEDDEEGGGTRGGSSMAGPSKKKQKKKAAPRPKPKPKTRRSQLPPMGGPKSKAIISDSDSEELSGSE